MASHSTVSLIKLSDSDQTLADTADDIRGRRVRDCDGEDLGKVDDLLIDATERQVRFLRVGHGGILGIGATASFIPIDAIEKITEDTVFISESRGRVVDAPRYDPELVDDAEYFGSVYGYYGYTPYWGAGYVHPGLPHYARY